MKLGMATAALYSRPKPSMITHRVPIHRLQQKPLTEPVAIETRRLRWLAVLTAPACERRVADELNTLGFKAYCPLGRRLVSWQGGRQLKQKLIREFPVFSRYLFVGIPTESEVMPIGREQHSASPIDTPPPSAIFAGGGVAVSLEAVEWITNNWGLLKIKQRPNELSKGMSDKIVSILGDASGPVVIPPAAIARINALELAGEWDETKPRRSPFQPGVSVSIPRGPYAGFLATIDAQESETRLRVLVNMFGRQSAVSVDLAQVELVA